jgi:phenylalanyl-tRNA synthetase alpha chain
VLTEEGEKYAEQGSPEVQLFLAVPAEGSILKEELQVVVIDCSYIFSVHAFCFSVLYLNFGCWIFLMQKLVDPAVFKIGCSQAAKNKWVQMGNQISRKVTGIYFSQHEIRLNGPCD